MDVTLLRKLTLKSQLKFGKHADLTVQELINLKKYGYLIWVYFNSSMITFTDEILDLLLIDTELRIEKPGKNEENFKLHQEKYLKKLYGVKRLIIRNRSRGIRKGRLAAQITKEKIFNKRSNLQAINHGHKT